MKYNTKAIFIFFRALKILALSMSVLFVLTACQKDDNPLIPISEGKAPEFSLSSLAGSQVNLSDYSNKVVVLFFFGNSCPTCRAAAPDVESMLVTPFAGNTNYQVLGLDQWNGNVTSVEAFKTATGVSFPLLLSASGVAAEYQTTYDRFVVIDQNGNIVFSGTKAASADLAAVKQKVELLLSSLASDMPDDSAGTAKTRAPDFALTALSGGEIKLSDYSNKVLVLFFFGNTCPPCRAAAPDIESTLVAPYVSRNDYQVLGLDQWNGHSTLVQSFKTATGVSFPLLLYAASVAADYNTTYDRLVVIDKDGYIVFSGTRNASSDLDSVKEKVEMLLSNQ